MKNWIFLIWALIVFSFYAVNLWQSKLAGVMS